MLKISGLKKSFSQQHNPLFEKVNLKMALGSVTQITGPNGVGKTTLLKCIAQYLDCEFEELSFNDSPLSVKTCAFASTDEHCFFPQLSL